MTGNGSDILGEVYEFKAPESVSLDQRDFLAWHHPRKQWVRVHQICHLARKLGQESHFRDGVLSYLSLPGDDLLDIHNLAGAEDLLDILALEGAPEPPNFNQVKYLGFNNIGTNQNRLARQNYATTILADKPGIVQKSTMVNYNIQDIVDDNTPAFSKIREYGPFDIINLDLTTSLAPPSQPDAYLKAIRKILEFQRRHMADPFILCITTRSDLKSLSEQVINQVHTLHSSNTSASDIFKSKFEEVCDCVAESLLAELKDAPSSISQLTLNKVFGVGIGKWLIQLMQSSRPQWNVTLEHCCCYRVYADDPDMMSLAFKFTQVTDGALVDNTGLTANDSTIGNGIPETALATNMLERSRSIVDLDSYLEANQEIKEKAITQTATLLAALGFDKDKYILWANKQLTKGKAEQAAA